MLVRSISISISSIARISIHVPSRLLNSRRPPIALISISIPHVKKERKYNKKRNIPRKSFFFLPNIYHHYKSIKTNRILTPKPPPFPFFETFSPIFPIFPFIGINLVGTHFSLHRSGLFIEESLDNKELDKGQTKTRQRPLQWSLCDLSFTIVFETNISKTPQNIYCHLSWAWLNVISCMSGFAFKTFLIMFSHHISHEKYSKSRQILTFIFQHQKAPLLENRVIAMTWPDFIHTWYLSFFYTDKIFGE